MFDGGFDDALNLVSPVTVLWGELLGQVIITEEKLGRHRCVWRDLNALNMSRQRQCYNTAELVVVLIILSLFLQFPASWLVSKRKKNMIFQSYVQTLFSVDDIIVLLEENTARSPEFDYIRLKLANMVRWNAKQSSVAQKHRDPFHSYLYAPVISNPRTHPPNCGLSGTFTFYASESEWSPRFPGTKVSGAFLRPYFSTHGTPFVKQLIIAKRNTLVKRHCWQPWNKWIDLWAASK